MNAPTLNDFGPRLIPLSDGRSGLRGGIQVEIRDTSDPTDSSDTLDFISSDETLDRYGEIISAAGWKLSSYARNPVFQNAHQYGDVIFTLGKALVTEVRGGKLFQRIQFATGVNPMAKIAHGLYRGRFLNAVSVGFIPLRWQDGNDSELSSINSFNSINSVNSDPLRTPNSELRTPQFRRKYLEQELLEVSAVAIPANPHALALGLKSGAVEKSDLRDFAELIHQTLGTSRPPWTAAAERSADAALAPTPPSSIQVQSPSAARYARLMNLARQLHGLLKHT